MTEKNVTLVEKGLAQKEEVKYKTLDEYLALNDKYKDLDVRKGISLLKKSKKHKIVPSSWIAKPGDEKEIVQIFKEIYHESYPFKEFESESEILKMIENPYFHWLVFRNGSGSIIGCIGLEIDIDNKKGIFHGLVLKQLYQGFTDFSKLFIATFCSLLRIFEKEILSVSCEVRSAHSKTQYMGKYLGLLPIVFLPNKDIFFNKEESEIIIVGYREEALKKYRSPKTVKITRQVLKSYLFASHKHNIGSFKVKNYLNLVYKEKKITKCRELFTRRVEEDKFGNEYVRFFYGESESRFTFFHNKYIKNIERISYLVSSKEEFYVFIEKLIDFIRENTVRYCDCFISAYNPLHQTILLNAGFEPYGYVPVYKYNKKENTLEDQIVFVYYKGEVKLERLKLIPETKELIQSLKPLWSLPE